MDKLFDNLKKGVNIAKNEAGKLTKVVFNKTTNIVDITKLNLAKNEAEGKITKLYENIGELIYNDYCAGGIQEGKISDLCLEIDKFKAESDELKEQIAELKNTSACPTCGQTNDKDSGFCPACGTKLKQSEAVVVTPDEVVDIVPED